MDLSVATKVAGGGRLGSRVEFELFTSSFCGACTQTRRVLQQAVLHVPEAVLVEHAIEREPDLAQQRDITATPTVIIRIGDTEFFRATGVPTTGQVLTAAVRALDAYAIVK